MIPKLRGRNLLYGICHFKQCLILQILRNSSFLEPSEKLYTIDRPVGSIQPLTGFDNSSLLWPEDRSAISGNISSRESNKTGADREDSV